MIFVMQGFERMDGELLDAGVGFGPGIYAKTGTADIQGQEQPNSWLIAFDPAKDIAVGCLVVNAGYGASFAGPEVKAFLDRV